MTLRPRIAVIAAIVFLPSGCGKPVRPAADLPNTFRATPEFCIRRGLPPASFSISYPDKLKVTRATRGKAGQKHFNPFYLRLVQKGGDKKLREELTIGRLPGIRDQFLVQATARAFERELKRTYKKVKIVLNRRRAFRGMTAFQIHAEINAAANEPGLPGRYRMLVIILPSPTGLNGVQIVARARGDSPIKTFADFDTRGMIGPVLSTFRFEN